MSESPTGTSGCPVQHSDEQQGGSPTKSPLYNPETNDYVFENYPMKGDAKSLSTKRIVSTIPKDSYSPSHQPSGTDKWVYPSEQQYYNAMKRKGYSPSSNDMPVVLMIHNLVNEQGWSQIKEWEAFRGNMEPKLVRFMGKPKELSPKAYFLNLLG